MRKLSTLPLHSPNQTNKRFFFQLPLLLLLPLPRSCAYRTAIDAAGTLAPTLTLDPTPAQTKVIPVETSEGKIDGEN